MGTIGWYNDCSFEIKWYVIDQYGNGQGNVVDPYNYYYLSDANIVYAGWDIGAPGTPHFRLS